MQNLIESSKAVLNESAVPMDKFRRRLKSLIYAGPKIGSKDFTIVPLKADGSNLKPNSLIMTPEDDPADYCYWTNDGKNLILIHTEVDSGVVKPAKEIFADWEDGDFEAVV